MLMKKTIVALFAALISLSALNAFAQESNNTQTTQTAISYSWTTSETDLSLLDKILLVLGLSDNDQALKGACEKKGCCDRHCGSGKIR